MQLFEAFHMLTIDQLPLCYERRCHQNIPWQNCLRPRKRRHRPPGQPFLSLFYSGGGFSNICPQPDYQKTQSKPTLRSAVHRTVLAAEPTILVRSAASSTALVEGEPLLSCPKLLKANIQAEIPT